MSYLLIQNNYAMEHCAWDKLKRKNELTPAALLVFEALMGEWNALGRTQNPIAVKPSEFISYCHYDNAKTISSALQELQQEGYISITPRSGKASLYTIYSPKSILYGIKKPLQKTEGSETEPHQQPAQKTEGSSDLTPPKNGGVNTEQKTNFNADSNQQKNQDLSTEIDHFMNGSTPPKNGGVNEGQKINSQELPKDKDKDKEKVKEKVPGSVWPHLHSADASAATHTKEKDKEKDMPVSIGEVTESLRAALESRIMPYGKDEAEGKAKLQATAEAEPFVPPTLDEVMALCMESADAQERGQEWYGIYSLSEWQSFKDGTLKGTAWQTHLSSWLIMPQVTRAAVVKQMTEKLAKEGKL